MPVTKIHPSSKTHRSICPLGKIATVVGLLEEESFTGHDLDTIGRAFEEFFGQIFRGQLGQYFTRRELTRYIVGSLEPTSDDFILDPTVGSGGFLLEALFQVWGDIEENYSGDNTSRLKFDFARNHLYGVEIHEILARICKTNLLIHKDGHTNVEGDQSCLDTSFDNDRIDNEQFDMVLGNPPFGDQIEQGDTDRLGQNSLSNFELKQGAKLKTEIAVIERAIEFLEPGGELGFVVPDGLLNNGGEQSNCPQFRRYLLRNGKILGITSLPDHTFTKAGAQNKTSVLLFKKFSNNERQQFHSSFSEALEENEIDDMEDLIGAEKWQILTEVLEENDHQVFLSEAEEIGYAPTGETINKNDLYTLDGDGLPDANDNSTILGQYHQFVEDKEDYESIENPKTMSISASEMISRRDDGRIDPKHHLFREQSMDEPPEGMTKIVLGDVLEERDERVDPTSHPDTEFQVPTITHDGHMVHREAGKHNNPIAWEGQYFSDSSKWHYMYEGDVVFSRIDLWKGAVSVVDTEFDRGICTTEFPIYKVVDESQIDRHFLRLLLRSEYFQNAIQSITTGHSNRRRTSKSDFEDLEIFVPEIEEQRKIAAEFENRRRRIEEAEEELDGLQDTLDRTVTGEMSVEDSVEEETEESPETQARLTDVDN